MTRMKNGRYIIREIRKEEREEKQWMVEGKEAVVQEWKMEVKRLEKTGKKNVTKNEEREKQKTIILK